MDPESSNPTPKFIVYLSLLACECFTCTFGSRMSQIRRVFSLDKDKVNKIKYTVCLHVFALLI